MGDPFNRSALTVYTVQKSTPLRYTDSYRVNTMQFIEITGKTLTDLLADGELHAMDLEASGVNIRVSISWSSG